jgi:outer membrane protein OmpA-like peptidoglycan-associated protein
MCGVEAQAATRGILKSIKNTNQTTATFDLPKPLKELKEKSAPRPSLSELQNTMENVELHSKYQRNKGWYIVSKHFNKRTKVNTLCLNNRKTGEMAKVVEGQEACFEAACTARRASAIAQAAVAPLLASHKAAQTANEAAKLALVTLGRMPGIEEEILEAKLRMVQRDLDLEVGDTCPFVTLDVKARKIVLKEPCNFIGGKAQIVDDSLPVMKQITVVVLALAKVLKSHHWAMLHIQIDGHVHPTGKDMRCLVISYFRAAEVARQIVAAGLSREYMHVFGYGGTRPVGAKDKNRRVEISLVQDEGAAMESCKATGELWRTIKSTPEFSEVTADPSFSGPADRVIPMSHYMPPVRKASPRAQGEA